MNVKRKKDSDQQHMEGTSRRALADKLSSILLQYFDDNFETYSDEYLDKYSIDKY